MAKLQNSVICTDLYLLIACTQKAHPLATAVKSRPCRSEDGLVHTCTRWKSFTKASVQSAEFCVTCTDNLRPSYVATLRSSSSRVPHAKTRYTYLHGLHCTELPTVSLFRTQLSSGGPVTSSTHHGRIFKSHQLVPAIVTPCDVDYFSQVCYLLVTGSTFVTSLSVQGRGVSRCGTLA